MTNEKISNEKWKISFVSKMNKRRRGTGRNACPAFVSSAFAHRDGLDESHDGHHGDHADPVATHVGRCAPRVDQL